MPLWSALLARPSRTPLHLRPSLTLFFLLVGAFFLTFVPHVQQLPLWISIVVVASLIIRSVIEVRRLPLPSSLFCGLLAICLLVGIFIQFNTMFGRQAGTAFMAGLLAIKFFELRGPRDIAVIIFSSFFVVMSTLLFSQDLELFIYCLVMMWVLTSLLMRVQIGDRAEDHLISMLRRAGLIFFQALPLAIFLFFFFPRFAGKLQLTLNEATLGLSDSLQPGSIARLSKDDSPALYVRFVSGDIPTIDTMYWRALVLWEYQSGSWVKGRFAENDDLHPPVALAGSKPIEQEITIYPHFQKWLFALDHPIGKAQNSAADVNWSIFYNGGIVQLRGGQLDHKERYNITSSDLLAPRETLSEGERKYATALPLDDALDHIQPEVRALADRLYQEARENGGDIDQAYVSKVLSFFRREKFTYTASPGLPPPNTDWLSYFLFKSKAGFCEHLAAAFAVLMRLEHVPARVVVGYQGAQVNPYDNSYLVRQANAHAWNEVWIESKKNWIRVDPTTILMQSEGGPADSANASRNEINQDISIQIAHTRFTLLSSRYMPSWARRAMVEMQLRRQQIEASWDDWVFSYDPDTQSRLAQALGLGKNPVVLLILACIFAIVVCGYVGRLWLKRKPPAPPIEAFYTVFCRNMAQRGIPRALWEGPLAYTDRAAEAFPDKKDAIRNVGRLVARSRYAPPSSTVIEMAELEKLLTLITASQAASSSRETQES